MISTEYIKALKRFRDVEIELSGLHGDKQTHEYTKVRYSELYDFVERNAKDFVLFDDSGVTRIEYEFSEAVAKIRHKLVNESAYNKIPLNGIFIPRYKITDGKWDSIIHCKVADLIRDIFDNEKEEDFQTLRQFTAVDRKDEINKWIKTRFGKNFLFETQVSIGLKKDALIRKRLYLFDKSFEYVQMQYMSGYIWIHNEVIKAHQKWKKDNTLWKSINHLKRKIETKEILDESRLEIQFRRLLESNGLKGQFIHDEQISWKVIYRPDFWFVNENLVVEYDEKAHKFQVEEDKKRERIIKRYLPNVTFIRVNEGAEQKGLDEIKEYLASFKNNYEA